MTEKVAYLGFRKDEFRYTNVKHLLREASTYEIKVEGSVTIGDKVHLGFGAFIGEGTTIGDNISIGAHAYIHGSTEIKDDVIIGDEVKIYPNSKIGEGTIIGDRTTARETLRTGKDCEIGNNVTILEHCSLSNDVIVGSHVNLHSFIKLKNNSVISCGITLFYGAEIKTGWEVNYIVHRSFGDNHYMSGFYIKDELYIQMGCYTRTPEMWSKHVWDEEDKHPTGTLEGVERRKSYEIIRAMMPIKEKE